MDDYSLRYMIPNGKELPIVFTNICYMYQVQSYCVYSSMIMNYV